MGLYIKGMEMPKDPFYPVHATIYADGTVITGHGIGESAKEAIPIPPHGRLGDLDALTIVMAEGLCPTEKNKGFEHPFDIFRAIDAAPTVIPTEEET